MDDRMEGKGKDARVVGVHIGVFAAPLRQQYSRSCICRRVDAYLASISKTKHENQWDDNGKKNVPFMISQTSYCHIPDDEIPKNRPRSSMPPKLLRIQFLVSDRAPTATITPEIHFTIQSYLDIELGFVRINIVARNDVH